MGYYKDRQKTQDLQNKMIKAAILNEPPLLLFQLTYCPYEGIYFRTIF
ncbi:hypothetical protein C802_02952 [Phocaeicola sartorii]|jgi:hypothetical protein|uniref:Uncharacterized protein n=1 Tax=Phocaeicola sartorii TaxID=671267 RepID=R9ICZ7_9BACT|nr:hypothetical protein C802_02952 [Phocaeicola sartorii]